MCWKAVSVPPRDTSRGSPQLLEGVGTSSESEKVQRWPKRSQNHSADSFRLRRTELLTLSIIHILYHDHLRDGHILLHLMPPDGFHHLPSFRIHFFSPLKKFILGLLSHIVSYEKSYKNIFHLKNHCSSTGNMSFFSGCFLRLLLLLLVFSNFIIVYFVLFKCVYEWVCVCVSSSCLEFSEILRSVYNFIKLDKFSVFDFHNFFCLCLLS